ncbi:hypothetical protein V2J09_019002 [Rumex salicifolius]
MSSPTDNNKNPLERMESRKSHSWWENHTNPRNARWLATSLKDMERNTVHMMKLIEDDEDSFARKAEMYYKRRPELITQVHEYQRMYRILAQRYEQLTVDLQRHLNDMNIFAPSATDSDDEPITPRFHTDVKINPFRSFRRPAGFDVFLSDRSPREVSPALDYEEPDFSSVHHDHVNPSLPEKTILMDAELDNNRDMMGVPNAGYSELQLKIASYEVEIGNLKMELESFRSSDNNSKIDEQGVDVEQDAEITQEVEEDYSDPEKIKAVFEELNLTKGRIHNLEKQNERLSTENKLAHDNIHQLKDLLKEAQTEVTVLRSKLDTETRKSYNWGEQISRYRSSLKDREAEIRELKVLVDKKSQLHDEIARLTNENNRVKEELKELEVRCHSLELQQSGPEKNPSEEAEQLKADITEKREELEALKLKYERLLSERDELTAEVGLSKELKVQVERQKELILEVEEEKREAIRQLCNSLEYYRRGYEQLREASSQHKELPAHIAS